MFNRAFSYVFVICAQWLWCLSQVPAEAVLFAGLFHRVGPREFPQLFTNKIVYLSV